MLHFKNLAFIMQYLYSLAQLYSISFSLKVESYFPEDGVKKYEVLNQKNWPAAEETYYYGLHEITEINELYGDSAKKDLVVDEWRRMLTTIMNGNDWCKFKKEETIFFWKHYLITEVVPPLLKGIVRKVLAIPIGSADAERSFSTLFHIRTKRRSRLKPSTLDNFLRIRLNGPKDIRKFPAIKFAKLWKLKGHFLTDDPKAGGNPGNKIPGTSPPANDYFDQADEEEENIEQKLLDESTLF